MPALTREPILARLKETLEPLPYVHAMWEGGAAAWGRVDEWSDIDVVLAADDDRTETALADVERTLSELSPVSLRLEIRKPTWHGHDQAFFRLRDASPFLVVDCVVMGRGAERRFLAPERHGNAVVHFDKVGFVEPEPLDAAAWEERLAKRRARLPAWFDAFQVLVTKELHRGNLIEAVDRYHVFTLRPLVEALRLRHVPARHDFHIRYVHYDLPPEDVDRLQQLYFVKDAEDLREKRERAEAWFRELMCVE